MFLTHKLAYLETCLRTGTPTNTLACAAVKNIPTLSLVLPGAFQIGGKVTISMRAIPIPAQQRIYRGSIENTLNDRTSVPLIIVNVEWVAEILPQI